MDRWASGAEGWVSLGLVRTEFAEALAQVLRGEGMQVVTREDLNGITLSGGLRTEMYVLASEEKHAREIAAAWLHGVPDPPVGVDEPAAGGASADDSEELMGWLGRLFDAADRLRRRPTHNGGIDELAQAADAVLAGGPPYGFEPTYWRQVGQAAERLRDAVAVGAASDVIRHAATTVCDLVRDRL